MTLESKFVAGLRVAILSGGHGAMSEVRYRPAEVDKVYKNGNFTLRWMRDGTMFCSPQQYRPNSSGTSARETGSAGWRGDEVVVWDEKIDAELAAQRARGAARVALSESREILASRALDPRFPESHATIYAVRELLRQFQREAEERAGRARE